MNTLIICLPPESAAASTRYDYARTADGRTPSDHAQAPLALLPSTARSAEVVAVLPIGLISWHAVDLPQGVGPGSPRLKAVLESLLEDQLLDDPADMHFALSPGTSAGQTAWVAACNKAWLSGHLRAFEAAQRPVTRVVPEFAPESQGVQLYVLGDADAPQLVALSAAVGSVLCLPLSSASVGLLPAVEPDEEVAVFAEPALAAAAEQVLQRPVELLGRHQRWVNASRSAWDLAQFDLVSSGRNRAVKRFASRARDVLESPAWRPARWGVALIVLANVLGLNAWAWKEQSALKDGKAQLQNTLLQTFPAVKVVVDAPLQMEREVAALRQATGATSQRDLEAVLTQIAKAAPANTALSAIEFGANEVRLKPSSASNADSANLQSLQSQLAAQGWNLREDGGSWVLKLAASP